MKLFTYLVEFVGLALILFGLSSLALAVIVIIPAIVMSRLFGG